MDTRGYAGNGGGSANGNGQDTTSILGKGCALMGLETIPMPFLPTIPLLANPV